MDKLNVVIFCGGVISATCFSLVIGYEMGRSAPVPKICPAVANHQVISTSSTKDGEYCTYTKIKGKVLHPVKI